MEIIINVVLIAVALYYLFAPIFRNYYGIRSWIEIKGKLKQIPWIVRILPLPIIPLCHYASHILDGQESLYGNVIMSLTHAMLPLGILIFAIYVSSFIMPCVFIEKKLRKVEGTK